MANEQIIKTCPRIIKYLPAEFQTRELCMIAIKRNRNLLQYIHNQFDELCVFACTYESHTLAYVNKQTLDLCIRVTDILLHMQWASLGGSADGGLYRDIHTLFSVMNPEFHPECMKLLSTSRPDLFA